MGGRGQATRPARTCAASPPKPACGAASHRISRATPTPFELAHEGVPLNVIQRQLGHTNLGVTWIYPQGIDNAEIIVTVDARRAPMIPATTGLRF